MNAPVQLGLLAYVAGSETSKAAAESMHPRAPHLRQRVLDALRANPGGLTDEQLQALTGLNPSTQRPRRVELVGLGLVQASGRKAPTASGRMAVVWEARQP